jgi:hypothetical protein
VFRVRVSSDGISEEAGNVLFLVAA